MGLFLRILGILWIGVGALLLLGVLIGSFAERPGNIAYTSGAFLAACVLLAPVWLTGIAFFLLPGWIRKQLGKNQSDTFS